jgi:hypothetical protein
MISNYTNLIQSALTAQGKPQPLTITKLVPTANFQFVSVTLNSFYHLINSSSVLQPEAKDNLKQQFALVASQPELDATFNKLLTSETKFLSENVADCDAQLKLGARDFDLLSVRDSFVTRFNYLQTMHSSDEVLTAPLTFNL